MITIKNNLFERPIQLDESFLLSIVIENKKDFRNFLLALKSQLSDDNGLFQMYVDGIEKPFNKNVYLVTDPLFFDIDDKKSSTIVQKGILSSLSDEQKESFNSILCLMEKWLNETTLNAEFKVEYNNDINISDILKMFSVKFSKTSDNIIEFFIKNIIITSIISKTKIFFVTNLSHFFNNDELEIIYKELLMNDIHLILLESDYEFDKVVFKKTLIVDKDLAEIHINFE